MSRQDDEDGNQSTMLGRETEANEPNTLNQKKKVS